MLGTCRVAGFGVCLILLCLVGCNGSLESVPATQPVPPPAAEIPVANLPVDLREWNWTNRLGIGSCAHASFVYHLRWQNQLELAERWRATHSGGESATSMQRAVRAEGLPFNATTTADPAFLDWASRTRRGAIIWFFKDHAVHFCGWATVDGIEYAILCDNNRIERYLRVERSEFLRRWKQYDGFALSTTFSPVPPALFPAFESV
ncbi:hypothetical protein [Rosistilla oblonga]|uniref:Peptidase C39-like domain-containing protein n=1 Tax=Rosistilla oblonga TaxID=2527990 RepID=A0A518ITT0_9BACT|nr:hypothetical protein [Rosistilla oblonga]QDV56495.1 hypothetical protein Mal33_24860 [Rosistilla oblonga]